MILCCGEALIDFVPLPQVRAYSPCPGGSVYNIAVGLGRLQAPAGFFCRLSTDYFGDLLLDYLAENEVDASLCPRSDDPTTLAFVSLPGAAGEEPRYMFYANDAADRNLTAEMLPRLSPEIRALHFGSISLVMEPGATALETLMRRESGQRTISLDPNVRPGLIDDSEAYRRRFERWLGLVDIVRLSLVDFDFIYPGQQLEPVMDSWFERGLSLCIITKGAEGALGKTALGVTAVSEAPQVQVADTVGAGDTFLAAALAYLEQEDLLYRKEKLRHMTTAELQACLAYAGRAAAINCSRQGANPPYKQEMETAHA
ncbi:MAG: carbohydrate kinase [Chloroflexi bacterium]|jgi:fructokinase|nr:carbohydrate kinase [Chloroflexota bacterium]